MSSTVKESMSFSRNSAKEWAIASARGSTVLYNVEMFMVDMRVLEREHAFVRLEAGHLRNHVQKGVSTMRC